jgi:NAD(P)-dependent dehydrogenase (short-subunit alcohol dehydrogenase family)
MKRLVLEGKVAVITGGARGIGRAICERYVEEGAKVAVADIDLKEAEAAAKAMGESTFAVPLDVGRQESIDAMVSGVVEQAGSLDILVNAGVVSIGPFMEITPQIFDRIFAVNVKGLLFTLQAVARQMLKQGRGGKVINMASQAGRRGEALVAVYCASKAAVISITQSAGLALIKDKINVNGISPGVVDTPMWDENDALFAKYENRPLGEKKRIVGESVPYSRMGLPEDHAGAAVFLASSDSDYLVAQTLNVDGGNWLS